MAKGIREVRNRIDTLLTTTAGLSRPMATTLRKELERAIDADFTAEQLRPSYVLRWAGDADAGDLISQPVGSRLARFELDISMFLGGGEGAGSDTQEADAALADIWEDVVQVIESPSNRAYATTGILRAMDFVAGKPRRGLNGRLTLPGKFAVQYDQDYPVI